MAGSWIRARAGQMDEPEIVGTGHDAANQEPAHPEPRTPGLSMMLADTRASVDLRGAPLMKPEAADRASITWRVALRSSPRTVHQLLSTARGRESFWAESAPERDGRVLFTFPNGETLEAEIVETLPSSRFCLRYFDGTSVVFSIADRPGGGSLVTLRESRLSPELASRNSPGWVSVLLNLKAVSDHGVDLRNHSPGLTWTEGFVDN